MDEIINKLEELSNKADEYMAKRNQSMRSFGCGMLSAVNEILELIYIEKPEDKLQEIAKEVIQYMGHAGVKINQSLYYDGKPFCESISNGGRTNEYYFYEVIKYMESKGYDRNKFNIKVGDKDYIQ